MIFGWAGDDAYILFTLQNVEQNKTVTMLILSLIILEETDCCLTM